jgi:hypothetical protein
MFLSSGCKFLVLLWHYHNNERAHGDPPTSHGALALIRRSKFVRCFTPPSKLPAFNMSCPT